MKINWFSLFALIAVITFTPTFKAHANTEETYVQWSDSPGLFPIVSGDSVAPIYVDANDWPGVVRAARDLRDDIKRVSGKEPIDKSASLPRESQPFNNTHVDITPSQGLATANSLGKPPIIIGTLGHSRQIDQLAKDGKIDVSSIQGKWESFVIQVVPHALDDTATALVIVGSDKRGTIYGIYDLSQQMGVSPWYWWADVPTAHHDHIFVKPGKYTQGPPAVKYRGIFLNDEAPALSGWVREKFGQAPQSQDPPVPAGVANMNHEFYGRVFELLLRLRGNYLWPAMWNNAFNEDDPDNPKLADEYGIVMGTSHQEPMLRAQKEWDRRYHSQRWNYYTDPKALENFWREGVTRNQKYENILTIGLRGANDTPMIPGGTAAQSAELLKKIIADQRQLISEVIDPDPSKVPQLWCPYKEVLEYYDHLGLRVPDDVTILWPDDNWGNLRRVPSAEERKNPGGAGIYYHFDYVGGPRSYKWINTNPLPKVWEQMTQALENGADRIWIVNVGDLKPLELPISFFMKLAWDGRNLHQEQVMQFTRDWATQQFGSEHAPEVAELLAKYGKYVGRRKHELLDPTTFSVVNYNEADRVVAEWADLSNKAESLWQQLPTDERDAFFELVVHPIKASSILTGMYVAAAKNGLYATQGRASTNSWSKKARELFQADQDLSNYYNQILADGKWSHMMDQTHIGYTSWQEPRRNNLPLLKEINVPEAASMGVALEGESLAFDGTQMNPPAITFDSFQRSSRWIDIFNRGQTPFEYSITANAEWIKISQSHGTVQTEQRVEITIDWDKAPLNASTSSLSIAGTGSKIVVNINSFKPELSRGSLNGFVESNGYVSIEAEHYIKKIDTPSAQWKKLDDFGRTLSAMTIIPMTAASVSPPDDSPSLEYRIYFFNSGSLEVQAILSPTLEFLPDRKLRYAVSFDGQPPQIVRALPESQNRENLPRDWETTVKDAVRVSKSTHMLDKPGYHTLRFWMVDPALVLEKIIVDCGGLKPSYMGPPESYRGKSVAPSPIDSGGN